MATTTSQLEVRRIDPGSADYAPALERALGFVPPARRGKKSQGDDRRGLADGSSSDPIGFGAYAGDRLVWACALLASPGSSGMVYLSPCADAAQARRVVPAVQELILHAQGRSLALLQALVPPDAEMTAGVLSACGFRFLTRLVYQRRRAECGRRPVVRALGLRWMSYSAEMEPDFRAVIERSYVQSQDCPELPGVRSTAEVLAGHRAVGAFDPSCWWMALRGEAPVGVVLLNRLPETGQLEVVYMGVAPESRGQGVGDALLVRAADEVVKRSANGLVLAVDDRNQPAKRLYARWGFVETAVRSAWTATPLRTIR